MHPVPHNLVRMTRFWRIKSLEQDFKYLYWTISQIKFWNLFTCKGTYIIDWVGRPLLKGLFAQIHLDSRSQCRSHLFFEGEEVYCCAHGLLLCTSVFIACHISDVKHSFLYSQNITCRRRAATHLAHTTVSVMWACTVTTPGRVYRALRASRPRLPGLWVRLSVWCVRLATMEHLLFKMPHPVVLNVPMVSTYIHTCIRTFIRLHIRTCAHIRIRASIHANIQTFMLTWIHTYMHAYIHRYIHTCIHTSSCL